MNDAPKIGNSYRAPARVNRSGGSVAREVTINSTDRDRHGTIIDPAGAELDAYRSNPVVLLNHDPGQIVGTSSVRYDEQNHRLRAQMERWAEDAGGTRQKVESGILRGASIGFRVLEKERVEDPATGERVWVVTRWELLEWSWVAVPSNPSAVAGRTAAGTCELLPARAVRQLAPGGVTKSCERGNGQGEIMLTDAQLERLLRGELRANVEASRRAGVCIEDRRRGGKTGTLRGTDARRAIYGGRYRLRDANPNRGRGK